MINVSGVDKPEASFGENSSSSAADSSPRNAAICQRYKVVERRDTESAILLFVREEHPKEEFVEEFVLKILRNYHDSRYSLETVKKRQNCQATALDWNRKFTPAGVYIGLVPVPKSILDKVYSGQILIGETIKLDRIIPYTNDQEKSRLKPKVEYALVMERLPEKRELDRLLEDEDNIRLEQFVKLLSRHIKAIHKDLPSEDGERWAGFEPLRRKLNENLALMNILFNSGDLRSGCFPIMLSESELAYVRKTVKRLKYSLCKVLSKRIYRKYFAQRIKAQQIKRCH